jgi:hypothetical protein
MPPTGTSPVTTDAPEDGSVEGWHEAVLTVVLRLGRRLSELQRMARFSLPRLGGGMDSELEDVEAM